MGREGKEAGARKGALEMTLHCSFCALLCKHVESHRQPLFWKEPRINCDVQTALQQALGLSFVSSPSLSQHCPPERAGLGSPPPPCCTSMACQQWKADPFLSPPHHGVPSQRGVHRAGTPHPAQASLHPVPPDAMRRTGEC